MKASRYLIRVASLAAGFVLVAAAATASPAAAASTHFTGTLADGATWIADVPSSWNGVLLLYSHGFGPLTAADAPDPASAAALLDRGYALAGSSVRPERIVVGAAECGARPVPDDRRRDRDRAAARTQSRDRGRELDGRTDQRARGAAGRGPHRRRALDLRNRRRRDPPQQLPARRRVRDGEAARDDAGPARELLPGLQRWNRDRVRAAGDREPGADDAAGPCPARARDGVPERDAGRARTAGAVVLGLGRGRGGAVRE